MRVDCMYVVQVQDIAVLRFLSTKEHTERENSHIILCVATQTGKFSLNNQSQSENP